jgi:hypothetical protein
MAAALRTMPIEERLRYISDSVSMSKIEYKLAVLRKQDLYLGRYKNKILNNIHSHFRHSEKILVKEIRLKIQNIHAKGYTNYAN